MKKKYLFGIIICSSLILAIIATPVIKTYFDIDISKEPQIKTYHGDGMSFLKTYFLMEKGNNYYIAFKIARDNFASGNSFSGDTFTWRMPTVFYIWNFFTSSAEQILTLFLFLTILSFISIYLLLKKISTKLLALFGSLLLIPYFYDALVYKASYLFVEWWGLFFFIFGLTALFYKYPKIAVGVFFLAVVTRELFIIPILSLYIFCLLTKKESKIFLIPILGFIAVYVLHIINISQIVGRADTGLSVIGRVHGYDILSLQKTVSFSMRYYIIDNFKVHYLLGLAGLISLIVNSLVKEQTLYLLVSVLSLIIILPFIAVSDNDYWGILIMPWLIMSVPLIFNLKK